MYDSIVSLKRRPLKDRISFLKLYLSLTLSEMTDEQVMELCKYFINTPVIKVSLDKLLGVDTKELVYGR